ncbi:hypothetical protein L9F63_004492, partial [Diploptera punctata]
IQLYLIIPSCGAFFAQLCQVKYKRTLSCRESNFSLNIHYILFSRSVIFGSPILLPKSNPEISN